MASNAASNAASNVDDREGHLLAQAQFAIRTMLAKKKRAEDITLTDIERLVGAFGDELLQGVTQTLVNETPQGKQPVGCPARGAVMRSKGSKPKQVVTVRGEVVVERAYYYCSRCGRGFFPSGCAVGVE